jgi:O-antigen/teichoic acid export membrane protein
MIPAMAREQIGKLIAHPVTFLLAVNVVCAVMGLAQFAFALAVLKPEDFAVIGVLAAIGGVVVGLFDVKLAELTMNLYYATDKSDVRRRVEVLSASLGLHLAAGFVVGALVLAAAALLAPRLLQRNAEVWFAAAMALRMAIVYPQTVLTSLLRVVGDFTTAGWLRLGTQVVVTVITVAALLMSPDLRGYFIGVAIGAAVSFAIALVVARRTVGSILGEPLSLLAPAQMYRAHLDRGLFLAGGSLVGLGKMLSRSADTLLVAALTNDTITGFYRIARQAYDNLAGLSDAAHQFYTPTIVDCIKRGRWEEYRKHRLRLMAIGGLAAAGAIAASWLVLRPFAGAYYPHYIPALPAFEVLAGLLVVTLGIHGWLWPAMVASGAIGRFGVLSIVGALAQLVTMALLARLGMLDATTAATTAWIMALASYGPPVAERLAARVRSPQ